MSLRVARIDAIADGVFRYDLRASDGGDLPPFTAGAHITVWIPNDGTRCYSLSNDPAERHRYEIAVKREVVGRGGSIRLLDDVQEGDVLEVSAPDNWFALVPDAAEFLFIAGGIGITPIMDDAASQHDAHRAIQALLPDARSKPDAVSRRTANGAVIVQG